MNNNMTTSLFPYQESLYRSWVKGADIPESDNYDMQGYFLDQVLGGSAKQYISEYDNKPHFPDTYKLPNHPTFSKQSKYWKPGMPNNDWVGELLMNMDTGATVVDHRGIKLLDMLGNSNQKYSNLYREW